MATNNALSIKINGLETFSPSTKHFLNDYREISGYTHKRQKMMSVIRCGHIIERAGLTNLLAVVDTEEFFAADEAKQRAMIMRVLALGDFGSIQPQVKVEEPPARNDVENHAPEPAQRVISGHASKDVDSVKVATTSVTEDDSGGTEIVEPAPTNRRSPPSIKALRGSAPRK